MVISFYHQTKKEK
jgi:hypothetical protein